MVDAITNQCWDKTYSILVKEATEKIILDIKRDDA